MENISYKNYIFIYSASRFYYGALSWFKNVVSSQNFASLTFAVAIHLLLLLALTINNKPSVQPILSFTVTMMDISSSSSNAVASLASQANKAQEKFQIKNNNTSAANTLNESVKENLTNKSDSKLKSTQNHNSIQQAAVIAPTKQAIFDASYLNNEAPTYPTLSRQFEEEGVVTLNVFVDSFGKAQNVLVKKSSGFSRLDLAAQKSVKKWNFIPAKNGEKPVASWVEVPINFILEN